MNLKTKQMSDIEEIRESFKKDVDGYGRPKKLMTKVDSLINIIDKLTKEVEGLRKLKNNWIHKSSLFEEIAATEIEKNTKLKETIKEAHDLLHKCNSNDANVDRAIQLLTKNK